MDGATNGVDPRRILRTDQYADSRYNDLKKKENKENARKRVACLENYEEGVEALFTATYRCRECIVKMMNDATVCLKLTIMLDF